MKFVTAEEMREIDERAATEFGISPLILMENAGRGCADLLVALIRRDNLTVKKIHLLCGKGNNGGDGFVLARHLWNRAYEVSCWLSGNADDVTPECRINFEILRKCGISILRDSQGAAEKLDTWISEADLFVDALFGTGLSRSVSDIAAQTIRKINDSGKKIFSIDVPSGMQADFGTVLSECIKATWTATLGLPKKGFSFDPAAAFLGELFIVDIGLPRILLDEKANA